MSNFARDLLSKIYYDPVFKVTSRVCTKIAQLSAARVLVTLLVALVCVCVLCVCVFACLHMCV